MNNFFSFSSRDQFRETRPKANVVMAGKRTKVEKAQLPGESIKIPALRSFLHTITCIEKQLMQLSRRQSFSSLIQVSQRLFSLSLSLSVYIYIYIALFHSFSLSLYLSVTFFLSLFLSLTVAFFLSFSLSFSFSLPLYFPLLLSFFLSLTHT